MVRAAVIIPAAGFGTRMQLDHPKQYHNLGDRPMVVHTVAAFAGCQAIDSIVVVVPQAMLEQSRQLLAAHQLDLPHISLVAGGKRRQDSVKAGLDSLHDEIEVVLVHDGARPLISQELILACIDSAHRSGACIAAVPVKDTLKRGVNGLVADTVDREGLWQAQTPQAARLSLLKQAFAAGGDQDVTDEAMLLEKAGIPVAIVVGSETNIKVTRPEDLTLAEKMINPKQCFPFRIGHGYDAHRFAEGRRLVLGGVTIDYAQGLAGHSDADVVTHALCDALLGALGCRDIGYHFPDNSDAFKDIYSITLLEKVVALVTEKGYSLGNCDITIVCQAPKLAEHMDRMQETIARACQTDTQAINIKATTTEKMGFTGRKEGIACHAVALLSQIAK